MRLLRLAPLIIAGSLLGACNGGGGNSNGGGSATPDSSFSAFVKNLFATTADNADPVPINEKEFTFSSNDDETAFNELL